MKCQQIFFSRELEHSSVLVVGFGSVIALLKQVVTFIHERDTMNDAQAEGDRPQDPNATGQKN